MSDNEERVARAAAVKDAEMMLDVAIDGLREADARMFTAVTDVQRWQTKLGNAKVTLHKLLEAT